jgi:hypothetical protein
MITKLPELIAKLPAAERALCERLFLVSAGTGRLQVPTEMRNFVLQNFGSLLSVEQQPVVKVTNRATLETTLFNELRNQRPQSLEENFDLEKLIEKGNGEADPFNTRALDPFGRIEGAYSVSASNIAKLDVWHGVVIFNEYHPLKFEAPQVIDYLMTAREWAEAAHQQDPKAVYFTFLWNCLWRSGSSVVHGHAQMVLGRDMHYGKIEQLRRDALAYQQKNKRNYFNELVQAHRALGLTADPADMVKALCYLTPNRDKEIILFTDLYSPELGEALYKVLSFYKSLGVNSFNVVIQMPPIASTNEDWSGFPVLARIVDRGDLRKRGSDVGSIDLFAANVVSSDPFTLASHLREWLRKNP